MLPRYFCVRAYAHLCWRTPLVKWLGRGLSRMNLHMSACVSFLPFEFTGKVVALAVNVLVVFQTLEREARIPIVHCIDFHLIPLFLKQDPEHQLCQIPELLRFILSRKSEASPVKHLTFNPSLIADSQSCFTNWASWSTSDFTGIDWHCQFLSLQHRWAFFFFFYWLFSTSYCFHFFLLYQIKPAIYFSYFEILKSLSCCWNSSLFFFLVNLCHLFLFSHLEGFLEEEMLTHTQSALFKNFLNYLRTQCRDITEEKDKSGQWKIWDNKT